MNAIEADRRSAHRHWGDRACGSVTCVEHQPRGERAVRELLRQGDEYASFVADGDFDACRQFGPRPDRSADLELCHFAIVRGVAGTIADDATRREEGGGERIRCD